MSWTGIHASHVQALSLMFGSGCPKSGKGELRSGRVGTVKRDLSFVMEPLQGYLLSCFSKGNFFTDPESLCACLELLEGFVTVPCKLVTMFENL